LSSGWRQWSAFLSISSSLAISRVRAERALDTWFDVVIVSCEVGLCKPDPAIYRTCIEQLGVPPALTLFVDDRMENLDGAEAVGLRTFHFTGEPSVPDLRSVLDL
jgi:putative hydrolase of the HAD superfamily